MAPKTNQGNPSLKGFAALTTDLGAIPFFPTTDMSHCFIQTRKRLFHFLSDFGRVDVLTYSAGYVPNIHFGTVITNKITGVPPACDKLLLLNGLHAKIYLCYEQDFASKPNCAVVGSHNLLEAADTNYLDLSYITFQKDKINHLTEFFKQCKHLAKPYKKTKIFASS